MDHKTLLPVIGDEVSYLNILILLILKNTNLKKALKPTLIYSDRPKRIAEVFPIILPTPLEMFYDLF